MTVALVVDEPGFWARLWMRLSPSYDQRREAIREQRAQQVHADAIKARLRIEGLIAARDASALRGYRNEAAAMRRAHRS